MATQSLYRRYRPRRFSEIRGQEHVVRALRNAVINEREGQGYLFSGPRGTGKTTSARVLAKVLNCTNPVEGEPCCECDSCLAVQAGTSYDVHELDAASNNGVEAMRDLIEKASLGTPGRHKVYILDEVHMLSKGAEAALLKTLEEPPPHVVFVLATTDPQKVSPTIRSRVQHLEFHLLPMDELEQHIRWVASDAGLTVSEEGIQSALAQGGGSARDTLSALELVAASGGDAPAVQSYDEFIEALIVRDPGQALAALAHAIQQGRDPRTLAQELIRHLRDCFLSLMAPELVQLPDQQAARLAEQAPRLGAAAIVRAMERLGETLVEMRHTPDPRLLLDVALVQLTHDAAATDPNALAARIERLEKAVAAGAAAPAQQASRPAPVDPATGRAALGGRARRDDAGAAGQPAARAEAPGTTTSAVTGPADAGSAGAAATSGSAGSAAGAAATPGSAATVEPVAPTPNPAASAPAPQQPAAAAVAPPTPTPSPPPSPSESPPAPPAAASAVRGAGAGAGGLAARVAAAWSSDVLPSLKPMARALFSAGHFLGERDGGVAFGLPNETHRSRCEGHRRDVEDALGKQLGAPVKLVLVVDSSPPDDHLAPVVQLRGPSGGSSGSAAAEPVEEEAIDLDDLVDAPPGSVKTPEDRLTDAFPGSVFVDDSR